MIISSSSLFQNIVQSEGNKLFPPLAGGCVLIKSKDFIQIFVIYSAVIACSPVFGLEE